MEGNSNPPFNRDRLPKGIVKATRDECFTQVEDSNIWECMCKKRRKVSGHGFTNLVAHVSRDHPL